jgi:ArsR family transcriptional regulator, arsenate/arsenite/antimonite-responsive transcriptional repressor
MATAKTEEFNASLVKLAEFAKALSHPARIEILRILGRSGELACMEIVRQLPLSQPSCSRHLGELLKAGLLKSRAEGNQIFFCIDATAMNRFCASMNKTLHPS